MPGSGPDRNQKSPHAGVRQSLDLSPPELDEATQLRLGGFLAGCVDQLVREPMPDVFLHLIARMEAKGAGRMIAARAARLTLDDIPRLCVEAMSWRSDPGGRDATLWI
jgi:hypothetical protein